MANDDFLLEVLEISNWNFTSVHFSLWFLNYLLSSYFSILVVNSEYYKFFSMKKRLFQFIDQMNDENIQSERTHSDRLGLFWQILKELLLRRSMLISHSWYDKFNKNYLDRQI